MKLDRPLQNLLVVDFGRGLAPALATKILVELGARVVRFVPGGEDPFDRIYPANQAWHAGKEIHALDEEANWSTLLCEADVCIIGGEDYPGIPSGPGAERLKQINARLVIGEIRDAPRVLGASRPAVDILAQARSGTMWEELADRPVFSVLAHPSYGAALQLLAAIFAALHRREQDGRGAVVSTSLFEGALAFATPYWFTAATPDPSFDFMPPKSPQQMIFRCADGQYVQLVLGVPGAKAKLYGAFGLDTSAIDPADRGVGGKSPRSFYGDYDLFEPLFAKRDSADVLKALTEAGLPNVEVLAPGACWTDPQVETNNAIKRLDDGTRLPGLPFDIALSPSSAHQALRPGTGQPLSGIRVLDLGAWVAGPFASVPLADLGAEVIKVEPPEGDPHRFVHRSFAACNRGKRSISLDLKTKAGMEKFTELVSTADVVQHNFRPGVSSRLGIDPVALHAINPHLIVVESSAFGHDGPRAQRPGFDQLFQAFCGHEIRAAGAGNPPFWSRLNPVDVATGLASAVATSVALYIRCRSGGGAVIRSSLLRTGIFLLSELVQDADGAFLPLPSLDRQQTGFHPAERIYQTADGWVAIAARGPEMAERLCDVLRVGDRVTVDPWSWGNSEAAAIAEAISTRKTDALLAELKAGNIWAERCNARGEDILRDQELVTYGTVGISHHSRYGEVRQIGALARVEGCAVVEAFAVPEIGQHDIRGLQ